MLSTQDAFPVWPRPHAAVRTSPEQVWDAYFAEHPGVARLHVVASRVAEHVGPMCWAALIVLFLWALTLPADAGAPSVFMKSLSPVMPSRLESLCPCEHVSRREPVPPGRI